MRISISTILVGLILGAVGGTTTSEAAFKHALTKRDCGGRCPKGQQAVIKPDDKPTDGNGCGVGILAGKLPFEKDFHECCNEHDRCYGKRFLAFRIRTRVAKQRG